jgi:hypothetical protein
MASGSDGVALDIARAVKLARARRLVFADGDDLLASFVVRVIAWVVVIC